jgi:nucleoside-diphosphate-sugar epimerase
VRTVITGGAGFIGRAVVARLAEIGTDDEVVLVDQVAPRTSPGCVCRQVDLADVTQMAQALEGADRVIHLAALPGGAAEADPVKSRSINLDVALNMIEQLGRTDRRPRLVYASSVAVFGAPLPDRVDDQTPPRPSMTYGTHKLMVEAAFADAVRRGTITGIAVRLPGIVARPAGPSGLKSAFMSDVFRKIAGRHPYALPVPPDATMWLLSSMGCADALLHAAALGASVGHHPVVTLPALRVSMSDLVAAIGAATGSDTAQVTYRPDARLTEQFGRLPPLSTPAADSLGFLHDVSLQRLVARVLSSIDGESDQERG